MLETVDAHNVHFRLVKASDCTSVRTRLSCLLRLSDHRSGLLQHPVVHDQTHRYFLCVGILNLTDKGLLRVL